MTDGGRGELCLQQPQQSVQEDTRAACRLEQHCGDIALAHATRRLRVGL